MNQNKIIEKLKLILEIEADLAKDAALKNPMMQQHLIEVLEVKKFVNQVKEVPMIYA